MKKIKPKSIETVLSHINIDFIKEPFITIEKIVKKEKDFLLITNGKKQIIINSHNLVPINRLRLINRIQDVSYNYLEFYASRVGELNPNAKINIETLGKNIWLITPLSVKTYVRQRGTFSLSEENKNIIESFSEEEKLDLINRRNDRIERERNQDFYSSLERNNDLEIEVNDETESCMA